MRDPTPRQRLLATLSGEITDRTPVAPFVQDEFLAYYYPNKSHVDRVFDAKELADELDFDLIAKPKTFEKPQFLRKSCPGWNLSTNREREGALLVERLTITTPGGELVQEEVGPDAGAASAGIHRAVRKHLLATDEDIELFLEHVPEFDKAEDFREQASAWRNGLGERGVLAPWGAGGVFNLACELMGIEELLMHLAEGGDLLATLTDIILPEVRSLARSGIECVGVQGNMANAAIMSADFFSEYVRPHEQKILDAIHAEGAFSIYHNCGYARAFYEVYREMGMTVWETVSPPPQGDNDLAEAKHHVGDRLTLLGNLDQITFLKTASTTEIARRTSELVETCSPGGHYIFSTSDFLERDTPVENIRAMIEAAKEAGRHTT